MSDTPRTDAHLKSQAHTYSPSVNPDFARQLERELTTAKNIIADLLANPYPHDMMAIRKEASGYTSEEYAAEDMEAYCTEEAALKARAEWNIAQETAREFLKL